MYTVLEPCLIRIRPVAQGRGEKVTLGIACGGNHGLPPKEEKIVLHWKFI